MRYMGTYLGMGACPGHYGIRGYSVCHSAYGQRDPDNQVTVCSQLLCLHSNLTDKIWHCISNRWQKEVCFGGGGSSESA